MKVEVPKGKYVLAVSGGVDSMALLDLLSNSPGVELVVAHFNHGIRKDAGEDEKLVAEAASRYGWPLEVGYGRLGPDASEAAARLARYEFLDRVKQKYEAKAIMTAHQQDDLIETALLNLLRGTHRHGLTSLASNKDMVRPLLKTPKTKLINYAAKKEIKWREDSSNSSDKYLRNYLRLRVLSGLSALQRAKLISNLDKVAKINQRIDEVIATLSQLTLKKELIDRQAFALLPDNVSSELMAFWLKSNQIEEIDKKEINRLKVALKTAPNGSRQPLKGGSALTLGKESARFESTP